MSYLAIAYAAVAIAALACILRIADRGAFRNPAPYIIAALWPVSLLALVAALGVAIASDLTDDL